MRVVAVIAPNGQRHAVLAANRARLLLRDVDGSAFVISRRRLQENWTASENPPSSNGQGIIGNEATGGVAADIGIAISDAARRRENLCDEQTSTDHAAGRFA